MKKLFVVVLCLVLALTAVACSSQKPADDKTPAQTPAQTPGETPATAEKGLIGITVPEAPTGWVAAVQWAADQTAKRLGLNYKLLVSADENTQANHIDELIQLGCETIVLMPHNDTLGTAAQKIKDAGITLINFDRTLGATEPDYYVAGDNYQMGVIGADYIAEKLGGKGKVVIANIPAYGEIFNTRVKGFRDTVAEKYPEIEILQEYGAENGAPETGLRIMTDVLTAYPDGIDAIYSTDDELSIGLIQAINEAGRMKDIKAITGGGGSQVYFKVMEQYPEMAISSQTYDPYMMIKCVEIAAGLQEGKTYDAKTIIPAKTLDLGTYKAWLDENHITPDAPY
ncbi:MAG: substrate-binding domain-containing protein [Clostridiaceae bacterium]|nr:substrate-binding domain-containing protein [Clostridiaceae bacterium]